MALSEEQKRIVRESINHLLDFSKNQADFSKQMRDLMIALTEGGTTENDFYWIGQTWQDPMNYLKAISQQGSDTTIGEVRSYLIDFLYESIRAVALNHSPFDPNRLLTLIPKVDYSIEFRAIKTRVDTGENMWDMPPLAGHIFTRQLRFVEEELPALPANDVVDWELSDESSFESIERDYQKPTMIVLEVCVTTNNQEKMLRRELEPLRTRFADDAEEASYIARIKQRAELDGLHMAATVALQHFSNVNVRSKEAKLIKYNRPAEMLLTHQFYYAAINEGKLKLSTIAKVKEGEAGILLDPSVVNLLSKKIVTFSVAKSLTPAAMTLVRHPVYHPLLLRKKINTKMLQDISTERCHFLIDPRIANLIQRSKLTVAEALTLPLYLHKIITHNGYLHYFESAETDWPKLAAIHERLCGLLIHPRINFFVVNQQLPLAAAADILSEPVPIDVALLQLHAYILANRCMRMISGAPCFIQNEPDTTVGLQREFVDFTYTLQCEANQLRDETIKFLTMLLNEFMTSRIKKFADRRQQAPHCQRLLNALKSQQASSGLDEFIETVRELQQRLRKESYLNDESSPLLPSLCDSTLFHAKKKRNRTDMNNEELLFYCDEIMKLSPFLVTPRQSYFGCSLL